MAVSINGTSGLTFNDGTSVGTASSLGMRNRIINGAMEIDQRNAGTSVTIGATTGTYTLDRWGLQSINASKFSVQQNAGSVTPPVGFINYLGLTSLAATSSGSTDYYSLYQPIEGVNVTDLAWGTANAKTVTVSFWVRSSLTGTFSGSLANSGASRSYPFSYTISSANTWEYKTITIAGDTTGTWLTTNGIGVYIRFDLGCGSSFRGTANTWAGANYYGVTSAVSVIGTNGATFYLTGVQLEVGSVATPFERRLYPQELAMCQRYYEKSYDPGFMPGANPTYAGASLGVRANGGWTVQGVYKVTKRTIPTVTTYSPANGTAGTIRNENLGGDETATVNTSGVTQFSVGGTGSTTGVLYSAQWAVSAEL